jgi:hypothetical protein
MWTFTYCGEILMARPIEIRTVGDKRIAALIRKLGKNTTKAIEKATLAAVLFVHQEIPDYPVEKPSSTYDRTFILHKTITTLQGKSEPDALSRVEVLGARTVGYIGTKIEYGQLVIGEGRQAQIHQGRWYTLQGVVRKLTDKIADVYQKGMRKFLKES